MVELGQRRYLVSGKQDDTVWDAAARPHLGGTEPVLIEPGGVSIRWPTTVRWSSTPVYASSAWVRRRAARPADADLRSLSTDSAAWTTPGHPWAGHRSAVDFCRFAESFADETELPVWQSLLQGLSWCERFLTSDRASTTGRGSRSGVAGDRADRVGAP
jgi:hypothetical protein